MTGKIYISKGNPQDVLRNAVAERKEMFDHSSKRFLSCVEVAENGTQISEVMVKKIEITLKVMIAIGVGILIWEWFQIISLI